MNVIEIKNLTKQYGSSRGIVDVNLAIQEGEIFGFIGPNGAGKSTTIRTMLSLIFPSSGSVTIFGKDAIKEAPEIAKEIGYLPAEVFYYEDMRVIDLLNYSASFYKKDCSRRIQELAQMLELDLHKKIEDLSYGNKKKVGIVQGLLHEPKLIILDEPTSGLDPLMQQKFFDLLRAENQKGATILFSSHILSEVQKLCHRVAIIKEGRIVKVESISALKENSYKKVEVEVKTPLTEKQLNLDGISKYKVNEGHVEFLYSGNINVLVNALNRLDLNNLMIFDPDLEEIFMHYYE